MGEGSLRGALFAAVVVIAVSLVASWLRPRPFPAPPAGPEVGRPAAAVTAAPDPRFAGIRRSTAGDRERRRRAEEEAAWDARLGGAAIPAFAEAVIVHALPGDLPPSDLEEGPPWHLVLGPEGAVSVLPRFREGRPAVPAGLPPVAARRALHVAVPSAAHLPESRREALRGLCRHLRRRMGREGRLEIRTADGVPGSEVPPVSGFPAELLQPPTEEK